MAMQRGATDCFSEQVYDICVDIRELAILIRRLIDALSLQSAVLPISNFLLHLFLSQLSHFMIPLSYLISFLSCHLSYFQGLKGEKSEDRNFRIQTLYNVCFLDLFRLNKSI